jgi:hypothetical protein
MKILFENKQLNEGPGAGYTVSGTLANVKVNKIEYINKMDKNSDLVEYEVGLDATADFEDVSANSYYYGGTVESTPVAIDRVVVEFDDGDITESDVKWAIENAKIEANLGGGWSHSTFNGRIDVDYMSIENASYLNAISFELTDERAVTYLDKAVQNENTETQYGVVENHWVEVAFDTAEDAIEYAKANGYDTVQELYVLIDINGDEIDTEFGDVVWTNDVMDESIEKKDGKTLPKDIQKAVIGLLRTSNMLFSEKNMPYATDDELISIIDDFIKLKQRIIDMKSIEILKNMSNGKLDENLLTESFKETERIQALAEYLGINPSEISNIYDLEFETPEGDYLVVDEDEAKVLAKEDIESLFDDLGLDSFTPDFKDWIIMNALDNDWFEEAVRESYEYYVEDIEDEASSMGYENRLIEEMHDHQVLSDDDFAVGEDGEPDLTTLNDDVDVEDLKEEFIDLLVENAGNAVDYCGDNFGWDWVTQMATQHGLIDMNEVVEQCIYMDGVAHFIARYDGEEHDLGNGLFAYRTN